MITLNEDWKLILPTGEETIGFAGENNVYTLQITQAGTDYADWAVVMDVDCKEIKNIWAVDKAVKDGNLILSVPIKQEYIPQGGYVYAQFRFTSLDGRVKKSDQLVLYIKSSINAPDIVPSPLPQEFADYELRIIAIKDQADKTAEGVTAAAQVIADSTAAALKAQKISEDIAVQVTADKEQTARDVDAVQQIGEAVSTIAQQVQDGADAVASDRSKAETAATDAAESERLVAEVKSEVDRLAGEVSGNTTTVQAVKEIVQEDAATTHADMLQTGEYATAAAQSKTAVDTLAQQVQQDKTAADKSKVDAQAAAKTATDAQGAIAKDKATVTTLAGQVAQNTTTVQTVKGEVDKSATAAAENALKAKQEADRAASIDAYTKAQSDDRYIPAYYTTAKGDIASMDDVAEGGTLHRAAIYGATTEIGTGTKNPDNPYTINGIQPTTLTVCGKETDQKQIIALPAFDPLLGDGTINDEYDVAIGIEMRKWARKVITGEETITILDKGQTIRAFILRGSLPPASSTVCTCSHLAYEGSDNDKEHARISGDFTTIAIYINKTRLTDTTTAGVKAYLTAQYASGTPITVIYRIATPTTVQHDPVTLTPYAPSCNVYADSGIVEVSYKQNLQAYILSVVSGLTAAVERGMTT